MASIGIKYNRSISRYSIFGIMKYTLEHFLLMLFINSCLLTNLLTLMNCVLLCVYTLFVVVTMAEKVRQILLKSAAALSVFGQV